MRPHRANCASLAVEFALTRENILLQNERITQLYVIQSEQDPFHWFGVLFVDSGIYMGAVIRFDMLIPETYPDSPCPRIIFNPIPYHPLIDPNTGELDTKNAFPDWNSTTHKLHQVLLFAKRVICQADIYIKQIQNLIKQDALNQQAADIDDSVAGTSVTYYDDVSGGDGGGDNDNGLMANPAAIYKDDMVRHQSNALKYFSQNLTNLFRNFEHTLNCIRTFESSSNEFKHYVDEFKQNCCHQLFDRPISCADDKNALVFTPWNPDVHEDIRSCVLAGRFAPTSLFASYHKETDSVSFVPGEN